MAASNGHSSGTQGRPGTAEGSTEPARRGAGGGAEPGKVGCFPGEVRAVKRGTEVEVRSFHSIRVGKIGMRSGLGLAQGNGRPCHA